MNTTVARMTLRSLVGRRRGLLLLLLPAVLLALALAARLLAGTDDELAQVVLGVFALGTLVPLLALIAGTGSIGPEIDDGSIVYLLAKPIRRSAILLAKLFVASLLMLAFGALPILVAGYVVAGTLEGPAASYALAAAIAGIAYCALFILLAVLTRNAVVVGLMYALVWESLVAQIVPGAQAVSIQQWSLSVTHLLLGDQARSAGIDPKVGGGLALALLVVLVVAASWLATQRLRTLRIGSDDA